MKPCLADLIKDWVEEVLGPHFEYDPMHKDITISVGGWLGFINCRCGGKYIYAVARLEVDSLHIIDSVRAFSSGGGEDSGCKADSTCVSIAHPDALEIAKNEILKMHELGKNWLANHPSKLVSDGLHKVMPL